MGALDIVLICICAVLLAVLGTLLFRRNKHADDHIDKPLSDSENSEKISRLEGRLRLLQLELEESEDEADRLKGQLSSLRTVNQQLEEDIETQHSKTRDSLRVQQEKREEIERLRRQLDKAIEAHSVIDDILSAESVDTEMILCNEHDVDSLVEFISISVRDALCSAGIVSTDRISQLFGSELNNWAATTRKGWLRGKTAVAFIGEFSSGKTTIVNRILTQGHPEATTLPVDVRPCTAIATYITGGKTPHFRFVNQANQLKEISADSFRKITTDTLRQLPGVAELISYFVLSYSNTNLDNISILDTPGFSSNDKEDALRTLNVINECDALFWVVDANMGELNHSSLNIIKEHLTKPLYIIINKINTKSAADVDSIEAKIRQTLSEQSIDYNGIIRFSNEEPIHEIMAVIHGISRRMDNDSYILSLIEALEESEKEVEKLTHQAQIKANSLEFQRDNLRNEYNRILRSLHKDCQEVADIPKQNHRFLREDNYQLSRQEFSQMVELLNTISVDHNVNLKKGYQRQMEVSADLAAAWEEHSRMRSMLVSLRRCTEELKTKSQNLTR